MSRRHTYTVSLEIRIEFFFFNDTATTEIYTLSLHDALPISSRPRPRRSRPSPRRRGSTHRSACARTFCSPSRRGSRKSRSEEHTSELQSRQYLVCRLLLEKKNKNTTYCCND